MGIVIELCEQLVIAWMNVLENVFIVKPPSLQACDFPCEVCKHAIEAQNSPIPLIDKVIPTGFQTGNPWCIAVLGGA